jgi:hypothetical protein
MESVTARSLGLSADRILAKLNFIPPQNWSEIDIAFIVSTGRTGTRFLARFFDTFGGVYARHEPKPDLVRLGIEYAAGHVPFDRAVGIIERNRRVIARDVTRHGASTYLESNNRLFSLLKPLRRVFPNAPIIRVVRDGRDYVRSGLGRKWYTDKDRFPRLTAEMFPDDPYYHRWDKMSRFEKIAWRWQKKDSILANDVARLENTLTVRFEDIFASPNWFGLYQISRFLGFADDLVTENLRQMKVEKMNSTRRPPIPRWPEWDKDLSNRFEEIAGAHLRRCGYR